MEKQKYLVETTTSEGACPISKVKVPTINRTAKSRQSVPNNIIDSEVLTQRNATDPLLHKNVHEFQSLPQLMQIKREEKKSDVTERKKIQG